MAENEQQCNRSDGRGWQCWLPAMDGKRLCEKHYQQNLSRKPRQPVPDHLKMDQARRTRLIPKIEEDASDSQRGASNSAPKRGKRKINEASIDVDASVLPRKRRKKVIKEEILVDEDPDDNVTIKRLQMDLKKIKSEKEGTPVVKIGGSASKSVPSKTVRSKALSVTKSNTKSSGKNKKKCHWCRFSSYRVLVKCLTCKSRFFCEDCITLRYHDKAAVKRECPVCLGTCNCRPCMKGRPKQVKTKEIVVNNHEPVSDIPKLVADIPAPVVNNCEVVADIPEPVVNSCEVVADIPEPVVNNCEVVADIPEPVVNNCEVVADIPEPVVNNCEVVADIPEPVVNNCEVVADIPEPVVNNCEVVVYNSEKRFDKIKELHVVRMLLPLLEEINQEKVIELDTEAINKGKINAQLQVKNAAVSKKPKCSFCKSWLLDVHRRCEYCPYILCVPCCQDFRNGLLHSNLQDLKNKKTVRSKSLTIFSWGLSTDGNIMCSPKNLGGCGYGLLNLTSFSAFNFTKDLETSAKEILLKYKSKKSFEFASSFCSLCEGNQESESEKVGNVNRNKGLYFLTKQDFLHKNLKHFMKHWGRGQPLIVRDVLKSQPELTWDFGFLLCTYLEKSASATGKIGNSRNGSDWCQVEFGRKQIFAGGRTHGNAWKEFLKFKIRFSSKVFQDQFPNHYEAVMQGLPFQEYVNPLTGLLNLVVNLHDETQNRNLGPFLYISYGGFQDLMQPEFLTKLSFHAYDVVNILAHATNRPIPQQKVNEVKILMSGYNSQDHMKASKKIRTHNKLEKCFENSSVNTNNGEELYTLSDDSSSEDELCLDETESCGAHWDVFRREDVPKLLEFLTKYSNDLNRFNDSTQKIFHPIFDEIFYLESLDKAKLKEEFDVEPFSFDQDIGEAVFVPAGCPYQIKKIKSCVNVVLEFISPESALECVKLNNELRQLPVNHKARGKILEVKKMAINGVEAAIEEIRKASQPEINDEPRE